MDHSQTLLSDIVGRLRDIQWSRLPQVAADSGVPESTIKKIRSGEVKDPRLSTIESLQAYFAQRPELKEAEHA